MDCVPRLSLLLDLAVTFFFPLLVPLARGWLLLSDEEKRTATALFSRSPLPPSSAEGAEDPSWWMVANQPAQRVAGAGTRRTHRVPGSGLGVGRRGLARPCTRRGRPEGRTLLAGGSGTVLYSTCVHTGGGWSGTEWLPTLGFPSIFEQGCRMGVCVATGNLNRSRVLAKMAHVSVARPRTALHANAGRL
jgi:hypothetical protein